ncbi:MAG: UDP-N-acetylmuramoyl-L-alanyl-D-glutamate--2,6-diaminopimelate ligase [Pseudomonadota bacterium]
MLADLAEVPDAQDREIRGLASDSRAVAPGDLFLALPGLRADGREFIRDVIARGAAAVAYEDDARPVPRDMKVPVIPVADLRLRAGVIADRFYGAPSRELVVIGVTGTNGKTTCTQLLAQTLDRCAVIGTLGSGFAGALDASLHTTPDALRVHRLLDDFRARGAQHAAMEVSSHALTQGRVTAVRFKAAVFTNLTRDHLDYHGDMESYGAAKAGLFDMPGLEIAVINRDDGFGRDLAERLHGRRQVVTYGFNGADVRVLELKPSHAGLYLRAATPAGEVELQSPLFGRFNAYNLLAVLALLWVLGLDPKLAAARLAQARPAAGRVERFGGRRGQPLVVVDYAHTPDALEQVLRALREHTRGKIVCVFGCGGERDSGKRPQMGRLAEQLADAVIVTDDNPRREAPEEIIGDILAGMQAPPRVIRDRRTAIAAAIDMADTDDIVLVAGKGHEDYQQIGDARLPYSDGRTVQEILGAAA